MDLSHLSLYAEKFRFSAEFIEMRRQALDIFVNRIASHHELQQSEDLRTFLQADEEVIYLLLCRLFEFMSLYICLLQLGDMQYKLIFYVF